MYDAEGLPIAILQVDDCWQPDKHQEALAVFGTNDANHPGVHHLLYRTEEMYLGGKISGISLPHHYDYNLHRPTPHQLRETFKNKNWHTIVGFQTRNPMHRAHFALTERAMKEVNGNLLLHPTTDSVVASDFDYVTRFHCFQV